MERKIIFSETVEIFLKELVDILFEENYFGFKTDAKLYVDEIIASVIHYDFNLNVRKTPKGLKKFGHSFIKYKANNRTTWYIFFDQKENKYLINHILNNHSQEFPDLM